MYRIGQLAVQLNISPFMVRSLTLEWKDWLSEEAGNPAELSDGRRAVRRYDDKDIETLQTIMQLKDEGLNDEEVKAHLKTLYDNDAKHTSQSVLEAGEDERLVPRHEGLGKSATLEEALQHVETKDVFFKAEVTEEEAQEENSPPMISYRIGQVAAHLDISPFKLRQLSQRFADWLSEAALPSDEATTDKVLEHDGPASHLYDDDDVEVLQTILELEEEGLSDDEIDEQLDEIYADMASLAVIDPQGNQALMTPAAMAVLGQALHQLSETQQALLNTQQSHRDLLSVVVKDAMSVKEENERLRKRLRMMEEEMARLKESDWNHRLALEERLNELAHQKEQKRSWWGRLRGE